MSKPLLTEPEASQELEDAAWWYEQQRLDLGRRFLAAVDSTLDLISLFPAGGAPVPYAPPELGARRVPVKRFPYQVIYLDTPDAIHILAIAHDRRRPGYWLARHGP